MSDEIAGIEADAVTAWLADEVGTTGPVTFTRIKGGHSNLTYLIVDADGRSVVLRRPPLGELLPTAHDMNREWRFISAFHPTPVPVPEPLGYCEDTDVTGAPFYVMAFVDGHVMHDAQIALDNYTPEQRQLASESFIDVLADMHVEDPDDLGIGDIGRKEGYIERQLNRWNKQWNAQKTRELAVFDEVHDALLADIPEQGPARVVHGDYRLGNCITGFDGQIAAVLDWEIGTLGDPLADVGYVVSRWGEAGESDAVGGPSVAPGFLTRDELLDRYAERSGRDLSQVAYYVAFSHWKMASIVEGVYARYLAGALDTSGMDLNAFKMSVEFSASLARQALDG